MPARSVCSRSPRARAARSASRERGRAGDLPARLADHLRADGIELAPRPRAVRPTPPREDARRARGDPPRAARGRGGDGRRARAAAARAERRRARARRRAAHGERVKAAIDAAFIAHGCSATSSSSRTARRRRSATTWARARSRRRADRRRPLPARPRVGVFADMTRTFVVGEPPTSSSSSTGSARRRSTARSRLISPGVSGRALSTARATSSRRPATRPSYEGAGRGARGRLLPRARPRRRPRGARGAGHGARRQRRCSSPGDVVTVEPGLYRPGFGGCRLEDLVLVTDDGVENLTRLPVRSRAVSDDAIETMFLEERRYPPPPEFAAQANAQPDIYDATSRSSGSARARAGHLVRAVHEALRVGAAVREVVPRRQAERLLQLRRPARRGRPRRQGRLPLGGRARGRPARDHATPTSSATSSASRTRSRSSASRKGTPVAIYMGMVPELPVAMLACTRLGAPHTVVFGGFSADSLSDRMNDMGCEVLITQDEAWRRGSTVPLKTTADEAMADAPGVQRVRRPRAAPATTCRCRRAATTGGTSSRARRRPATCPCEPMDAEDLLFLMYTSGTTAKPKGIVHTTAGYLVGVATTHHYIFDLKPDDRRLLVRGRHRLDHRPQLHRLRAALQRRRRACSTRGRPTSRTRTAGGRSSSATA